MVNELVRAQDKIGKFDTLIGLKDGRIAAVEKRRLYESPFFLLTDPPNNDVASPQNLASPETGMRVSGEGPVQLTQLGAVRDTTHGAALVRLYMKDGSQQVKVSNVPIHIDTIFGQGGQMYPMPEGIYVDENRAMSVDFTDLTGAPSGTLSRICAVGAKYSALQSDPSMARIKQRLQASEFLTIPQFYGLNDGNAVLSAYQTQQSTVQIDGTNNFEIHQLSCVSTGPFLLNIVDASKGESIINAPRNGNYALPSSLFVGANGYPYRFHEPILVFSGQFLQVTLIDVSGSSNTIYLTLGGVGLKVRKWS